MSCPSDSLFFYGTLIHPQVLERVIGRSVSSAPALEIEDALLSNHVRLHISELDYPAVVDSALGKTVIGRELTDDESCVRGRLVRNLTRDDLDLLDEFEGKEYHRSSVQVSLIAKPDQVVGCQTYIWSDPASRLAPKIWSFDEFLAQKVDNWVGPAAEGEYEQVDKKRASKKDEVNGAIVNKLKDLNVNEDVKFGKAFGKKYFGLEGDFININHGSFGFSPLFVEEALHKRTQLCRSMPDIFFRYELKGLFERVHKELAPFMGADEGDIVLVNNATMGINASMHALVPLFEKGDVLLYIDTTIYNACNATLQYFVDQNPHLELTLLPVSIVYPITHTAFLHAVESAIKTAQSKRLKVRLALIDAISSNPGVVVPWEQTTKLLKDYGVISLIDGAHQIGQLPMNLNRTKPDFFVSNCHKWLMAHHGCAVLYVDKKYQYLMHSVPIGYTYKKRFPNPDGVGSPAWMDEFQWNGTIDLAPLFSVLEALQFRSAIGGEQKIYEYCHDLAVRGGALCAEMWGTRVMQNADVGKEGDLIGTMVNVELPLPAGQTNETLNEWITYIQSSQIDARKTFAPIFRHNGTLWTRLSGQIYIELSDFEAVGKILKGYCEEIKNGKFERKSRYHI